MEEIMIPTVGEISTMFAPRCQRSASGSGTKSPLHGVMRPLATLEPRQDCGVHSCA
jgi:hypothetical protein